MDDLLSLVLRLRHRHVNGYTRTATLNGLRWYRADPVGLAPLIEDAHRTELLLQQLLGSERLKMVLGVTGYLTVLTLEHQPLATLSVIDELRAHALHLRLCLTQQGIDSGLWELGLELQASLRTCQDIVNLNAQQLTGMVGLHLVIVTFQGIVLLTHSREVFVGLRQLFLRALVTAFLEGFLQPLTLLSQIVDLRIQTVHAVSLCSERLSRTLQIQVCLLITVTGDACLLRYGSVELVIHLTETVTDNHLLIIL